MNLEEFLALFGIQKKVAAELVGRSYFSFKDKALLSKRPLFIGECIAHLRGPVLIPSIGFLQEIGRLAKHRVVVNPEGEWLFICGRDVFGKSIVKHTDPKIGDRVVILNRHSECIGYGDVVGPMDGKVVVKRLFDIGDLLRRERKSRSF